MCNINKIWSFVNCQLSVFSHVRTACTISCLDVCWIWWKIRRRCHTWVCGVVKTTSRHRICCVRCGAMKSVGLECRVMPTALSQVLHAWINPMFQCILTPWHPCSCLIWVGTAIKHPVPDRVKQSSVISDIWALWRSGLSVRVPGCQKLTRSGTGCFIAL